jgi:beta-lactam-binding protein with PASTA domain/tRNA A-37 threonylcarbamoyl transferase component Bud32
MVNRFNTPRYALHAVGDLDVRTDWRVGTKLAGRYRLDERIASGGMATIYKARDASLGRDVAIKVMHPALAADRSFVDRFRAEATNVARLSHPNIVTVYDAAESDGTLFIVMELCEGITLRALLERFGHLDPPTVRHVARGIAAALDHAHAKGIVHRDVKPENVILTPDGQVKVVDFGIAKALGPQATQLTTDRPIGTVAYVAPEQINGTNVDGRADVYALGAITYEMLTGRPPFRGDTPQAVAAARMHSPVLSPGVSPSLDGAVMRATAARPDDRFATPGDFARALGEGATPSFLMDTDQLPDVAPTTTQMEPVTRPIETAAAPVTDVLPMQTRLLRRARRRFRIGSVLALLLVIAAIAAYAVMPKAMTVPDLRGQPLADAQNALSREGLRPGTISNVFSDTIPQGSIVRTDPAVHTKVKKGSIVALEVSKGAQLFDVPNVVGKTLDEARALMSSVGFSVQVGTQDYNDSVPKDAIIALTPDTTRAKRGTAFSADVSKGPPPVTVPDVTGKTSGAAKSALDAAGLTFVENDVYSDTVDQGTVISSDPAGGSSAPKGSDVTVTVSKGPRPFPMPNLVGMTLQAAKAKASGEGLVVRNTYPVPGSGKPHGQVQGQNPPAGTNVRKGTQVDLYYST